MTVSRHASGSDFVKVDAHEIAPEEYEEILEIDDAFIARAQARPGANEAGRPDPPRYRPRLAPARHRPRLAVARPTMRFAIARTTKGSEVPRCTAG